MESYLIPLITGFIGVLIGSITSIVGILIQSRYENKRTMSKHSVELALEDYRITVEHAKMHGTPVYPLSLYIHYHSRIMEHIVKGKLSKETIEKIGIEQEELRKTMIEANKEMNINSKD